MKKTLLLGFWSLFSGAAFAQAPSSTITFPTLNKIKIVDQDGSSQVLSATATTYRYVAWSKRLLIKEYGNVVFEAPIKDVQVDTALSTPGKIILLDLKLAIPSTSSGGGAALPAGGNSSNYLRGDNTFSSLNASHVSTGTLADARLSSNIPTKGLENVYTNTQRFNGFVRSAPNLTASGGSLSAASFTPTLQATANNDNLTAVSIVPTFINGSYTGVTGRALDVTGSVGINGNLFMSSSLGIYSNRYRAVSGNLEFGGLGGSTWGGFFAATGNYQVGGTLATDDGNKLQVIGSASFAGNVTINSGSGFQNLNLADAYVQKSAGGVLRISSGVNSTIMGTSTTHVMRLNQNGVGIQSTATSTDPALDADAILTLTSTTQGLKVPRMTATQRDAITNLGGGLIVFNSTGNRFSGRNSGGWYDFAPAVGTSDIQITDASKGIIQKDRVNGNNYRLVISNGAVTAELVN